MATKEENRELTKAEEQVMQVLWQLEKAFVKEIIEEIPSPKPAYNTVSTIVRILEKKGFVGYEAFGKSHRYHPLISKSAYASMATDKLMKGYFGNSVQKMLSFFVKENKISLNELDDMMKLLDSNSKSKSDSES